MDLIVPTFPGVPSYRQRTVLDGRAYLLAFRWAAREARWYLEIRDEAGELLASGIKVVANFSLLAHRRAVEGLPPGDLVAVDGRPTPADPGLDELGDVVQVVYREASTGTAGTAADDGSGGVPPLGEV